MVDGKEPLLYLLHFRDRYFYGAILNVISLLQFTNVDCLSMFTNSR